MRQMRRIDSSRKVPIMRKHDVAKCLKREGERWMEREREKEREMEREGERERKRESLSLSVSIYLLLSMSVNLSMTWMRTSALPTSSKVALNEYQLLTEREMEKNKITEDNENMEQKKIRKIRKIGGKNEIE